jgi:hypothetical protein
MAPQTDSSRGKPDTIVPLEKWFGAPNQNAFGSSVFFLPISEQTENLEEDAIAQYRYFVGDAWARLGKQNWIDGWVPVYVREPDNSRGILEELKSLPDREARQSAGLLLENTEDAEESCKALRDAFDSPTVTELRIFKVGDCSAMSGILIAAKLLNTGSLFLILLLD